MNDIDIRRLVSILEEIRDDQRLQIQRQAESLALQREQQREQSMCMCRGCCAGVGPTQRIDPVR